LVAGALAALRRDPAAVGGGVANALACGDLTNDGIDDIAIGAHLADPPSNSDGGMVRIIRGRDPFVSGTTIDLLSQSDATIYGGDTLDEFGTDLVMGDVNGDSIDDLIVGNEYSSVGLFTSEGRVFVFYGRSGFPSLINLASQSPDVRITGPVTNASFGSAVTLSDVNNDGILDIIAGADGWDPTGDSNTNWGAAYVFFGRSTFPSAINLSSTSPDIFVRGFSETTSIGSQIAGGDFNGDGFGDFMYASRDGERAGFNSEGRTFVSFGAATLPSEYLVENDEADAIINGGMDFLQLGDFIASGDVDGDGSDEVLIAAPFILSNTGRLYIFDLNPFFTATEFWNLFD
jgi:hypothetical protein